MGWKRVREGENSKRINSKLRARAKNVTWKRTKRKAGMLSMGMGMG